MKVRQARGEGWFRRLAKHFIPQEVIEDTAKLARTAEMYRQKREGYQQTTLPPTKDEFVRDAIQSIFHHEK